MKIPGAKKCKCGSYPKYACGTSLVRLMCLNCGVGTAPSQNIDKAVERWNAQKIEHIGMYK